MNEDHPVRADSRNPAGMRSGVAVTVGAVIGLALGILVSVVSDLPLAPEAGLLLAALVGWFEARRRSGSP